jgi:hypothetical protein
MSEAVGLLVDLHEDYQTLLQLHLAYSRARLTALLGSQKGDDVRSVSRRVLPGVVAMCTSFLACFVDRPVLTSTEAASGRESLMVSVHCALFVHALSCQANPTQKNTHAGAA